jgi:hypothetical protein
MTVTIGRRELLAALGGAAVAAPGTRSRRRNKGQQGQRSDSRLAETVGSLISRARNMLWGGCHG